MRANNVHSIYRWRFFESLWRANAIISGSGSESSRTVSTSHAECQTFRPGQRRAHIWAESLGWPYDEFKCREEVWFRRTRTPWDAGRTADQGIDGVSGSLKPVHAAPGDSIVAVRPSHQYPLLGQDAEKARQRRSRIAQRLNVPKRTPRLFARCGLAERPF
jgi:hypothetical protein